MKPGFVVGWYACLQPTYLGHESIVTADGTGLVYWMSQPVDLHVIAP